LENKQAYPLVFEDVVQLENATENFLGSLRENVGKSLSRNKGESLDCHVYFIKNK